MGPSDIIDGNVKLSNCYGKQRKSNLRSLLKDGWLSTLWGMSGNSSGGRKAFKIEKQNVKAQRYALLVHMYVWK